LRFVAALLVVQALLFVPCASAEIFKCVAKDGSGAPLYQNFPCSLDSLGLPSNPSAANATPTPGTAKPATEQTAAPAKTAGATKPQIGMSADDVRALLGDPETIEEDEPNSGRISTWHYADGRTLQFDHKQRVFEIQR
jgi:hypothetical protein